MALVRYALCPPLDIYFTFTFLIFLQINPPHPPTYRKPTFHFFDFSYKTLAKTFSFYWEVYWKGEIYSDACAHIYARVQYLLFLLEKGIFFEKILVMPYYTMFYNNFVFKTSSILATYKYRQNSPKSSP